MVSKRNKFSGSFIVIAITVIFLVAIYKEPYKFADTKLDEFQLFRLREGPILSDTPWLISYLKENYLISPSRLPYNFSTISLRDNDKWELADEKWDYLDKYIQSTFQNYSTGFFIEAGALDGEHVSNTLWLEIKRKWTGLLIEADPSNCDALIKKRRKAYVSCSCLTPHRYASQTILERPSQYDAVTSQALWTYRANSRSMDSRFHTKDDIIMRTASFSYLPVQCFPLQTYLYSLNVTTVDLLSLDTQGGEKTMLLHFPFDKIKIKHILVEYYKEGDHPTMLDDDFVQRMKSRGFQLVQHFPKEGNYIFSSV